MLNEGTIYRDVVRVKGNKKGRSCELPLLGLARGKSWVHGTWKEQSRFSRVVALEEHMNYGKQRGSRQDGNPNSS